MSFEMTFCGEIKEFFISFICNKRYGIDGMDMYLIPKNMSMAFGETILHKQLPKYHFP